MVKEKDQEIRTPRLCFKIYLPTCWLMNLLENLNIPFLWGKGGGGGGGQQIRQFLAQLTSQF